MLTLPAQTQIIEFAFDEATRSAKLTTVQGSAQDLTAKYDLKPSPDENRTLFTYEAMAVRNINVPLPVSAQKGAFRELFVKIARAIKKGIEEDRKAAAEVP